VQLVALISCGSEDVKECSNDLEWVEMQKGQPLPSDAIVGGFDVDNQPLYPCRASHRNNPGVPGKASASIGCNIPYGGREQVKSHFQVLTNPSKVKLEWKPLVDPTVLPKNAFRAGITIRDEQQYIGRCYIKIGTETSLVLGKVHKMSKGYPLYFSFEGGEITCWQYEILTCAYRTVCSVNLLSSSNSV